MERSIEGKFIGIGIGDNREFDERWASPELWRRVERTTELGSVLPKAFSSEEAQKLASVMLDTIKDGGQIRMGGRQVRELFGCGTNDIAESVIAEARWTDIHKLLRIAPFAPVLGRYPEVRMKRPDIDFFTDSVDLCQFADRCKSLGLETRTWLVSQDKELVEVVGERGLATVISSTDSWQTTDLWPVYGSVFADLDKSGQMKAESSPARFDAYPLAIPGLSSSPPPPDDPRRMAAICRALLWLEYSTDSKGRALKLPFAAAYEDFYASVGKVRAIIKQIANGNIDSSLYASSLRDLSVAMLSMTQRHFTGINPEADRFFKGIQASFG